VCNMARLTLSRLYWLVGVALTVAVCASGPPPPAPWFNEHIHINDTSFPPGVQIRVVQDYSNMSVDSTDNLLLTNSAPTPLYLAATPPPEGDYRDEITCPDNLCLMAASGRAYEWPPFGVETPSELTWRPIGEFEQDAPITLYVFGSRLGSAHYAVLWIDLRNEYAAGRPPDVEIPGPQDLTLPYSYGSELMVLSLTISYSLNQSYAPYEPVSLVVCLVPFVIAGVLGLLAFAALFDRLLSHLERRAKSRGGSSSPLEHADPEPPNNLLQLTRLACAKLERVLPARMRDNESAVA